MNISADCLAALAARLAGLEREMAEAASNPRAFRELIQVHARVKKAAALAGEIARLHQDIRAHRGLLAAEPPDPDLAPLAREELAQAEAALAEAERTLRLDLYPPSPNDERNAILEIRAGTGGDEAALFAGDLARMYTRYAERLGWKAEFIDASPAELGGYKEVIIAIQGVRVHRALQFEGGTHRVQRIPVTEASGRIHTSTATVAVLPEADEMDAIEIKPEDLRVDVYRASGAGGQHVNKTDSAVRLTHLPTGLVVASQEERSQHKNKAKALRVLRAHLLALQRRQAEDRQGAERRAQIGSGERSERIRTYNFPQNRLTDHRIHYTAHGLEKIMDGNLDDLFLALYERDRALPADQILDRLLAL